MGRNIDVEIVVQEGELIGWRDALRAAGGTLEGERPFTPPPEELDRFADAQFEPLMVIAVGIGVTALLNQILNLVDRLRAKTFWLSTRPSHGSRPVVYR